MNRLLSILVTLFILFLVYLWINHLTQGSGTESGEKEKTTEVMLPVEEVRENEAPPRDDGDLGKEELREEPAVPSEDEKPETPQKKEAQPVTTSPSPPAKPAPKQAPAKPQAKPAVQDPEAAGMHLVIAGNFLTRANAEERVKQLQKLGYPQAEVVNFELSEYHTACAGRFSDLDEARRVSKKIKEMHNIDTYVRLGN